MKVIAAGATPAAATAAASSSSQGGDGGLELLLHHASSSSLVSTAGSEGEEISVADERDTAYRRRRGLESQADEREKKEEQVEGEEEKEQKKMLKALQVYPATEKDDKLLHAANASRSPVPRWSRASARSSDDEEPTDTMVVAEAVRSQEAASLTSPVASIPASENSQESSISLPGSNIPAAAAAESSQDPATTPQHNEPERELSSFTQLQQGQDTEHCSVLLPPDNSLEVEEEVRVDQSYVSSSEVDRKKGGCYGCGKSRHLQDKEVCMVCSSKFCSSCMVKHMGSMPEGRKCVGCIGQPIHETRRPCVGKPSRLLKHMLGPLEVQQIMKAERECPANQFRPEQVWVNGSKLSKEEMALLLGCEKSPQKLKPGRFWYDSQTGLWGKEGHRPDNIISPLLKVGGNLQTNASNGTTKIFMNGRELGKLELKMLKLAGVHCPPNTHLWVENNGNYSEEGFSNIKGNIWGKEGNIWEKASIKLLYPFFSLPTPGSSSRGNSEKGNGAVSNRFSNYLDQSKVHKLLLLGHEGSGRSTIFKQAKILYNNGFTKEEKADFKSLIQANIFKYMSILLEARERFEEDEDDLAEIRLFTWNEKERKSMSSRKGKSVFAIEPRLKQASDRFLEKMAAESLESRFPSSLYTQEFAQIVEELWNNPAIKAVYERRAELYSLPTVANYYLDRVVEVSKTEYEPTENDILQAEGLSQGSGLVQIEFDLDDKVSNSGPWQDCESPSAFGRYQLIRVGGKSCDRQKWLEMFEDIGVIIFCVALSDYDGLWPDSSGTLCNKMMQTRDLFESILKYPCFRDTPFVLLLNKNDVFEDKIFRGIPLTACEWFSDFSPIYTGNQAQQAYQYIAHRYKELFSSVNSRGRKLFTFQLNALEKTAVSLAFQYVQETLKFEEHRATGFGMLPEDSCYSTDVSSFSQHFLACQPETDRRDRKQY
ncbi:unnamed protein product [Sphagnum jensenii]|uniref:Uncharacterized protein n=1 Tax=Sphagnum jensenii TaxID=128206 RepID=A0ABP1BRX9_9BRYO